MSKALQITIPHPCSQKWDEMTTNKQGRFCAHCNKTVIDFTTWSDAAIYTLFSKTKENVCGRFFDAQLDRNITIPYQPHSKLYRLAIAAGLTLLFTQIPSVQAQKKPPLHIRYFDQFLDKHSDDQIDIVNDSEVSMTGCIIGTNKKPLPGTIIQAFQNGIIKGEGLADHEGNYFIYNLSSGIYNIKTIYTEALAVNMQVTITDTPYKLDLVLKPEVRYAYAGGAVVRTVSRDDDAKKSFENYQPAKITMFPNPTRQNTNIRITSKSVITSANIIVTDMSGNEVYTNTAIINDISGQVEIPASALQRKGVYLVHVIAENINLADKLIVE